MKADRASILKHLQAVSRPRDLFENREGLQAVQSYIESELEGCGYIVTRHRFDVDGQEFGNVIARTGPGPQESEFIIGAHFDAVPGTPGADDNASGIAALLETARVHAADFSRNSRVAFIAFNAEEYGMLGSQAYVRDFIRPLSRCAGESQGEGSPHPALLPKGEKAPITGMISLEMVGYTSSKKGSQRIPFFLRPFYPDTGNFIALVGNGCSRNLISRIKSCFTPLKEKGLKTETLVVPGKGHLISEVRLSDHSPFWDAGVPAALVTDTSFFRNPHYHTPQDTIDTLDLDFLTLVTEAVIQTAASFAV